MRWTLEHSLELDRNHSNLSKTKYSTNKRKKLGMTIEHQIKKNTSFAENETCSAPASASWDPFVVVGVPKSRRSLHCSHDIVFPPKMKTQGSKVSYFPASEAWHRCARQKCCWESSKPVCGCPTSVISCGETNRVWGSLTASDVAENHPVLVHQPFSNI